jgi:outer membrane protein assembly factor BamB
MGSRAFWLVLAVLALLAQVDRSVLVAGEPAKAPGGVDWVGYRGPNGTCVFPDKPPTSCSEKTGQNMLWKIPMPNWGHSAPMVIGKRVFVISEGGWPETQDLPLIQCLDADTGKELWRKDLDHVKATGLSEADQKAAKDAWHTVMADFRTDYTIFNEYIYAKEVDSTEMLDGKKPESGKEAAVAKFKALGRNYGGWKGGGYGQLRSLKPKCDDEKAKVAAKAGLTLATWQHGCGMGQSCFGQTFPTPVTDGKLLYVVTAFGGFFCFDPDGNEIWCKYYPGKVGEYCRNGRSPLIYGDLLISDIISKVRAIDRKTGELKWSADVDDETFMSPVVITTGGKDILLCFNRKAFILPEGKQVWIEDGSDFGALAVVKHDERDVVFFTGGGEHGGWQNKGNCEVCPPSAVRFRLETVPQPGAEKKAKPSAASVGKSDLDAAQDDLTKELETEAKRPSNAPELKPGDLRLTGQVLWKGIKGGRVSDHIGLVYNEGKLYHVSSGSVLDPLTGQIVAGSGDRKAAAQSRAVGTTHHLLYIAGGHFYGLQAKGGGEGKPGQEGTLSVHTLEGKKVSECSFANAPVEGEKKKQVVEQNGWNTWMFSYACPFMIAGDRIYVRSYDFLWCVAAR